MAITIDSDERFGRRAARLLGATLAVILCTTVTPAGIPPGAVAQVVSGGASIPTVRTARGMTTLISLPEEAKEAVCGDLYDPQSGTGGFVVQRSGRDLFVKPLRAATKSNLFVKTERATYPFDLVVVPTAAAMRIVYVDGTPPDRALVEERAALARERSALEAERGASAAELDRLRGELSVAASERAERLAREWVERAVADDTAIARLSHRTGRSDGLSVTLGDAVLTLGGRSLLRCTLENSTRREVAVAAAESVGAVRRRASLGLVLAPGATATAVLAFDGPLEPGSAVAMLDASGRVLVRVRALD